MFHYMNEKEVTFNVKYEIVLYTPVFNARCPPPPLPPSPKVGMPKTKKKIDVYFAF